MKSDLVALGLPVEAPGGGGLSVPASVLGGAAAGAVALALLAFAGFRLRRRPQPVPA
jgi:hypothetical protein